MYRKDDKTESLKKWILAMASGEEILGVVIGEYGWSGTDDSIPPEKKNIVLSWDEASKLLKYKFYGGFGSSNCHAITAWTATKVMAISQYDGATNIFSLPRNPAAHVPVMPGG